MATSRPFAYNTGSAISGTIQIGDLAIGSESLDYYGGVGNVQWWNGPDETDRYIICTPRPSGDQPNPLSIPAYVGFYASVTSSDASFIELVNRISGESFTTTSASLAYCNTQGYWTNYEGSSPGLLYDGEMTVGFKQGPVTTTNYGWHESEGQGSINPAVSNFSYCGVTKVSGLPTLYTFGGNYPGIGQVLAHYEFGGTVYASAQSLYTYLESENGNTISLKIYDSSQA